MTAAAGEQSRHFVNGFSGLIILIRKSNFLKSQCFAHQVGDSSDSSQWVSIGGREKSLQQLLASLICFRKASKLIKQDV